MTRRVVSRYRPSTVKRWLSEGVPERRFEKLVRELAPSPATAARWRREERIPERVMLGIKPPLRKPATRPATVDRWLSEGIPARTFERLVRELAPSPATAARWRRDEVIPAMRLEALAPAKKKKKLGGRRAARPPARAVPPPPPSREPAEQLEELRDTFFAEARRRDEERIAELEAQVRKRDEALERAAIESEERLPALRPPLPEAEGEEAPPEDVYPLPARNLEFFREHDRTELEGVTGIRFDQETGRIVGVNDQGAKVVAYLFTNEDGQPKPGPDSIRWALAKDIEDYVAHVNRILRERYGDATMRGVFGRFHMPRRAA